MVKPDTGLNIRYRNISGNLVHAGKNGINVSDDTAWIFCVFVYTTIESCSAKQSFALMLIMELLLILRQINFIANCKNPICVFMAQHGLITGI